MSELKKCTKCGIEKSLKEFNKDSRALSGKMSWCKECNRQHKARPEVKLKLKRTRITSHDRWMSQKKSIAAKKRGFSLTEEQYDNITKQRCIYCGGFTREAGDGIVFESYSGVDRIDSAKGYELSNSVAACKVCNQAKNTLSQLDFARHVEKIYFNWAKKLLETNVC